MVKQFYLRLFMFMLFIFYFCIISCADRKNKTNSNNHLNGTYLGQP